MASSVGRALVSSTLRPICHLLCTTHQGTSSPSLGNKGMRVRMQSQSWGPQAGGIKADSQEGDQQATEPPSVAHSSGTRKCFLTRAFCLGSEDTEKTLRAPNDDHKQYLTTARPSWASVLLSLGPIFDWCHSMVYIKLTFLIMPQGNKRRTNENQKTEGRDSP